MHTLWTHISEAAPPIRGSLIGAEASVPLAALATASSFSGRLESFRGRAVLIAVRDPLQAALAILELDGVARRMVLCTPDLSRAQLERVAALAGTEAIVEEGMVSTRLTPLAAPREASTETEWVLLTSGTSGEPKLVLHSLASLTGAIAGNPASAVASANAAAAADAPLVWSTFYDIRRYGGLQIYLRAVLGGYPLVLTEPDEPVPDFLARAGAAGVTHISGTPSHWRRALMSGATARVTPRYVRLSGEIADQAILDSLRAIYPDAVIAHAFASTEAGVAFDVTDGRAGFPAALVGAAGRIDLKVEDGTLRIRSSRTAARYLGPDAPALAGDEGFVDTGDLVEFRDGRYYFLGRRGGIINVGGLKVHPEEVEAVINADPRVRLSRVQARRSPITGAIVVAEVVLHGDLPTGDAADDLKSALLERCRAELKPHKVPASLRFVPTIEMTAAGKLVRPSG